MAKGEASNNATKHKQTNGVSRVAGCRQAFSQKYTWDVINMAQAANSKSATCLFLTERALPAPLPSPTPPALQTISKKTIK
jgi:hypothetical protein